MKKADGRDFDLGAQDTLRRIARAKDMQRKVQLAIRLEKLAKVGTRAAKRMLACQNPILKEKLRLKFAQTHEIMKEIRAEFDSIPPEPLQ